jgi:hypothetical protein
LLWRLHQATSSFGYRPHWLLYYLIVLWLGSGWFYHEPPTRGAFVPADTQVRAKLDEQCGKNWMQCRAPDLPTFRPWYYSAELALPGLGIAIGQRKAWEPSESARVSRFLVAIETPLGALGALFLGAIVTGLIKRG